MGDTVAVCDAVGDALSEMLAVVEAEAPGVVAAVGDADSVLLPLSVEEGVGGGVPVADPVGVDVAVPVGDWDGVALALRLLLPVLLAETPAVSDGVGDALNVPLALSVDEGVGCGVPV